MGPKVRTDFDPAAGFTTFRTYAFAGLTDLNQGGVLNNSLLRKRLERWSENNSRAKDSGRSVWMNILICWFTTG